MTVQNAAHKFDVGYGTVRRWLDYYDLKRIPPKGGNEYPVSEVQKRVTQPVVSSVVSVGADTAPSTGERKAQIRDAIGLLKQAVDLLHTACQPKQAA